MQGEDECARNSQKQLYLNTKTDKVFESVPFQRFYLQRESQTNAKWSVIIFQWVTPVWGKQCGTWQMHTLSLCEHPQKTQMDLHTHAHTHPYPLPPLLSVLLTTPCQALKLDRLVAWWLQPGFQGTEVTLPHPPPNPPSFYSVSQWTLFSPLQSQGFKRQEDACGGRNTHVAGSLKAW